MMERVQMRWAVALLAGVALSACQAGEAAEEGPAIQTAEVGRGNLTLEAEATGTVEPIRSVEVKSKASGEIVRLLADVGDQVTRDELLAEVDPRDVRNAFDQTEADLEVARARVEITSAQLERSRQLLESQVITQQEHEQTRLDDANARATLVKAQTNHELAELRLSDVTIQAPLAGTIIQRSAEEGQVIQSASQNVSGGTTLFVMANLERMQVRALVDETDMGAIRAGLPATVVVEAFPDRRFRGTVQKVEPQAVVEQNVTMFPVIVDLDNRAGFLKPGMNAEVTVLIQEVTDVVLVPNGAVVQISDIGPAAMALGLDVAELDIPRMGRGARPTQAGPDARAGGTAEEGAAGQRSGRGVGEAPAPGDNGPSDPVRDDPGTRPQARGGGGDEPGAPAVPPARETRPAGVFVMNAQGVPELRMVRVGINDWDNTEVVSGLEEGEVLAVVGAAQLQAQQQEFLDRVRSRRGGGPFGR